MDGAYRLNMTTANGCSGRPPRPPPPPPPPGCFAPTIPLPPPTPQSPPSPAPPRGVDDSAYQEYRDGVCCGAAFVPIPSEVLSHELPVQSDEPINYAYSPPQDGFGTAVFEYTATNANGQRCSAELAVTVEPANDAPVASDDALELDSLFGQLNDVCRNASVALVGDRTVTFEAGPGRRRRAGRE